MRKNVRMESTSLFQNKGEKLESIDVLMESPESQGALNIIAQIFSIA